MTELEYNTIVSIKAKINTIQSKIENVEAFEKRINEITKPCSKTISIQIVEGWIHTPVLETSLIDLKNYIQTQKESLINEMTQIQKEFDDFQTIK